VAEVAAEQRHMDSVEAFPQLGGQHAGAARSPIRSSSIARASWGPRATLPAAGRP
jgi:hypothetical protein